MLLRDVHQRHLREGPAVSDRRILEKPFAEWPQPLRAAYLEGWSVATIGTGKSERDVMAGKPGTEGILLSAAWNMGKSDAEAGRKAA